MHRTFGQQNLGRSYCPHDIHHAMKSDNHLGQTRLRKESESKSHSVVSDSATPWTIQSMEFSRPEYWSGFLSLLQGIFPTQGSNPGLLHCRRILYQLSHKGSTSMKNDPKQFSFQLTLSFSTANNGSRMLCHYIQKHDNLKLNGCPTVHTLSYGPSRRHRPHSLHAKQGASRVCLGCFVLFTNYRYVQLRTRDF